MTQNLRQVRRTQLAGSAGAVTQARETDGLVRCQRGLLSYLCERLCRSPAVSR